MIGGRRSRPGLPEAVALRETFSHPAYVAYFLLLSVVIALAYLLVLPTIALDVTPGYFGLWVLAFLTPTEEVIAGLMGVLVALSIALSVYLWRRRACRPSAPVTASVVGGVVLNAMGSMICCGILVPLILSVFASGAALVAGTNAVRSFFSAYYLAFYALSFAALALSIHLTSRRFLSGTAERQDGPEAGNDGPLRVDTSMSEGTWKREEERAAEGAPGEWVV